MFLNPLGISPSPRVSESLNWQIRGTGPMNSKFGNQHEWLNGFQGNHERVY